MEHTAPASPALRRRHATRLTVLVIGLLALIVLAWPVRTTAVLDAVTGAVVDVGGGLVLLFTSALVLLGIVLALGPSGWLRLGGPEERPAFGLLSWLATLFAAGMGSGSAWRP
jgi:choline-glycine betaine transporter